VNEFEEISGDFKMVGSIGKESDSLQRTDEWLKDRGGCFTGSEFYKLMSCGRATSKLPWTSSEKLFDFGVTAEKYIYNVGQERRTGLLSMNVDSAALRHGRGHEDLLVENLIEDGVISDFEPRGLEKFMPTAGASVDGICTYVKTGERVALETKCCVSWDGHYKRMYEKVDEKHADFWQFQGEMLSVGLPKLLYVVAAPMQVEVYDTALVDASKIHQSCLVKRVEIADLAISKWGKGRSYSECLELACAEYNEKVIN